MPFWTTGPIENTFSNPVDSIALKLVNNNKVTANLRARVYDLSSGSKDLISNGLFELNSCSSAVLNAGGLSGISRYEVLFSADRRNVLFTHIGFDSSNEALPEHTILFSELIPVNGAALNGYPEE